MPQLEFSPKGESNRGREMHCKKKLRKIPMWTTVVRTKRRGGRKIPTPTSFGSAPATVVNIEIWRISTWLFLQCGNGKKGRRGSVRWEKREVLGDRRLCGSKKGRGGE
jgi:hypothetical protein